jgi:hypothetical protein
MSIRCDWRACATLAAADLKHFGINDAGVILGGSVLEDNMGWRGHRIGVSNFMVPRGNIIRDSRFDSAPGRTAASRQIQEQKPSFGVRQLGHADAPNVTMPCAKTVRAIWVFDGIVVQLRSKTGHTRLADHLAASVPLTQSPRTELTFTAPEGSKLCRIVQSENNVI